MGKSVMCLRSIGVRAVITALFLSLVSAPVPVSFAAPSPTPASGISIGTYTVPNYTQAKLPAISTCDPKSRDSSSLSTGDLPATGNTYLDAVTSTATMLTKKYGKSNDDGTEDEDEDIDGNATLDTDCDKDKGTGAEKLGIDADKLQCGQVRNEDWVAGKLKKAEDSKKYLACKRGVLDALRGEIGCFKKQIADAEGYMNELVNGQGGLAGMLNQANEQLTQIDQEVQDRQAQFDEANQRIEGGEGGNPPGLRQAKDAVTKLSTDLPKRLTQVNQQVENLRNQQARFNTLVNQLSMGRAMDCMNTPVQGYRCVKDGTSSTKYPTGSVSPLDYLKCIYAQSANKVVGGSVVKNTKREDALMKQATAAFTNAAAKAPNATSLPDFSDQKAFAASMKVYTVNNPTDLGKLLAPTLRDMEAATGKNMTSQFWADINRCYAQAQKEVAKERTDSNSQIKASETAMKQSFETTRSTNASAFRELRDSYMTAVKAATGQSLNIDTSKCENASLEDQAKCFDALNAMTDSLLTGKVTSPSSSLTGPALALTNGQEPIHGFAGVLMAKNNTQRTIPVQCGGIDDCLTKYTNLRTQLKQTVDERKQFKTNFQNNVNSRLLMTAKDLASKGVAGGGAAGVQPGMVTLNSVAAGIAQRKAQLETAMSKFGVEAGLDLDPKEVKEPGKDEGTGLYKPSDLKNLVLAEIDPGLPDNNSKGFTDATKAIGDRDKELTKLQDAIDTDYQAIQSKIAECEKDTKKLGCDKKTNLYDKCLEGDATYQMCKNMGAIGSFLAGGGGTKDQKEMQTSVAGMMAKCSPSSSNCGVEYKSMQEYCDDSTNANLTKDDQGTGGKKTGTSLTSSSTM